MTFLKIEIDTKNFCCGDCDFLSDHLEFPYREFTCLLFQEELDVDDMSDDGFPYLKRCQECLSSEIKDKVV